MSNARAAKIIQRFDRTLAGLEDQTLERINAALGSSYRQLEKNLLQRYPKVQANTSLLATQRAVLLLDEVKDLMQLLNTRKAEQIQKHFEGVLQTSNDLGGQLAGELTQAIANETLQSFAVVPLGAVRFAAENAVKRLSKHCEEFRGKASAVVTQGLIQGWGARKTTTALRSLLGTTKSSAERIARTEIISAQDEATRSTYKSNGIELVQRIGTQDQKICGLCAARAGNVYPVNAAPAAIHPYDRCYNAPYKREWAEAGLIDEKWIQTHASDVQAKSDQPLNYGLSYFEKQAGLKEPPKPVWTPKDRFVEPPKSPHVKFIELGQQLAGELGRPEEMEALRQRIVSAGMSQEAAEQLAAQARVTSRAQQLHSADYYREILAEFHQLTGGSADDFQGFIQSHSRAYALVDKGVVNVGDNASKQLLFHELAHHLEATNPMLAQAAKEWVKSRATGPAQSLRQLTGQNYAATEQALPDKFINPYVGKLYQGDFTEVISIGLEHFATAEGMQRLRERDPEHFHFMLGAIANLQNRNNNPGQRSKAGNQRLFQGLDDDDLDYESARRLLLDESQRGSKRVLRKLQEEEFDQQEADYAEAYEQWRQEEAYRQRRRLNRRSQSSRGEDDAQPEPEAQPQLQPSRRSPQKLNLKPVTPALKPIVVTDDLDGITPANESQQKALTLARAYQEILTETNEVLSKIPEGNHTLPADAYGRIYAKINSLMDRLKGAINDAKGLTGKVNDDVLERYMSTIASTSKEALPGYEIRAVTADIAKQAEERPC